MSSILSTLLSSAWTRHLAYPARTELRITIQTIANSSTAFKCVRHCAKHFACIILQTLHNLYLFTMVSMWEMIPGNIHGGVRKKGRKGKQPTKGAAPSQTPLWVTGTQSCWENLGSQQNMYLGAIPSEEQGVWGIYIPASIGHWLRSAECGFWGHYLPAFLAC